MDPHFTPVGEWILDGETILARGKLMTSNCLYAFLVEGQANYSYIGLTQRDIEDRMQNIRNAGESQPTNIRVRANIIQALKAGKKVKIHQHKPEGGGSLNASKMEFIRRLQPSWNIMGR